MVNTIRSLSFLKKNLSALAEISFQPPVRLKSGAIFKACFRNVDLSSFYSNLFLVQSKTDRAQTSVAHHSLEKKIGDRLVW